MKDNKNIDDKEDGMVKNYNKIVEKKRMKVY